MGGARVYTLNFGFLDPEVIRSIPKKQIANGITDAYTHVLEQYMTVKTSATLTRPFCRKHFTNFTRNCSKNDGRRVQIMMQLLIFMWSCTMALNGLIQKGVVSDWAIHGIGHELTAQFGIDHARTLAIIAPSHYRYNFEAKKEKLAQYAERVWNVTEGTTEEKALKGIEKMEAFFQKFRDKNQII